ncbi:DUF4013 domain-containing protein [Methanobrevibacter filiformis]|nr:DUF4013 domain-containing protein [Methanobrevibacter filiformis]
MIFEIFKDSFEYSIKNRKHLLKLGMLTLLSIIFIIPTLFLQGYTYRITVIGVNGMINGNDPLPKFDKLLKMLVEGIKIAIVRFIYLLPGTIIAILFLTINLNQFTTSTGYDISHIQTLNQTIILNMAPIIAKNITLTGGFIAIAIILWIAFYLISDIAITNMVNNKGSIIHAFKFKDLIFIIKSIGVFEYISFYVGILILFSGILFTFTLLFGLINSIISTIAILLSSHLTGSIVSGLIVGTIGIFFCAFIILPFFVIFKTRIVSLLYNMR